MLAHARKPGTKRSLFMPALCLLVLVPLGCQKPAPQANGPAPVSAVSTASGDSTHEMAENLQAIAATIDPRDLPFLVNEQRAAMIKAAMEAATDLNTRGELQLRYAVELVNAGK